MKRLVKILSFIIYHSLLIIQKTGLFFGSFNPIHVGHLIIANYMATQTDLDQVWLVVSPQNPLKQKSGLAKDRDRLNMARLATEDNPALRVSDIEFHLPKPSYTIDSLAYLTEKYPDRRFVLIMGGDNLATLAKWKNYEAILNGYDVYVYKRPEYALGIFADHPGVRVFDAPQLEISASYIRNCLTQKKSIQYLVPDAVIAYLEGGGIYR